jgi:hypothetical protein
LPRWAKPQPLDELQTQVGDNAFIGLDMKTPDPGQMAAGTYREGYNCRLENGDLGTRKGSTYPGSYNFVQYNRIWGGGLFSDPNGGEWLAVAVAGGVWFTKDGETPNFVPIPNETINYNVEIVQAFNQLIMYRGANLVPLVWNGDWAVFWEPFPAPTGGRASTPNADTAEYYGNRLFVPHGRDSVAVSDIADYTEYDWILDDFQVNSGQADELVRIFPWTKNTLIIFKNHSIFPISNVYGDLSETILDQLSNNIGLVGPKAVVQVGSDIYFMDYSGVYTISQVFETSQRILALPVSDAIKPVIDAINWNSAYGIRANSRRERVYFAVPLKNAVRNNVLIVYNLVTQSWESIDTFGDSNFRIDDLVRAPYNGERRLFAIDRLQGLIILLEQGKSDILGGNHTREFQIEYDVMTRGYVGPGQRSNFRRVEIDTSSWYTNLSVNAFVDGTNSKTLVANLTPNRTKYQIWGKKNWVIDNTNDDHATAYRQDYSVQLPVMIGYNGIQIEREQEVSQRYQVNMFGRYCQLRIANTSGAVTLRTIVFEGFEDQRQERSQI